jgi:hypothetical protein
MGLITFRTLIDAASGADYVVVAPYHPCGLTQFKNYTTSKIKRSWSWSWPF